MNIKRAFGDALRRTRLARGLTQEDFDQVSSRVYVSMLELGKRGATVEKVFQLAKVMRVTPVTLVAMTYLKTHRGMTTKELLANLKIELEELT
jgi:transcriptional regulator with XRE-family HTH domain